MSKLIHIRLVDTNGKTVIECDKPLEAVQGVSVFIHHGVNYSYSKLEGKFMTGVLFVECGTVEEF